MQVFGLPRQIIRGAGAASRLSTTPPSGSAVFKRDAVERWLGARQDGLSAAKAARAVGAARSTLYRWRRSLEFKSRRADADIPDALAQLGLRPLKISKFLWATEV